MPQRSANTSANTPAIVGVAAALMLAGTAAMADGGSAMDETTVSDGRIELTARMEYDRDSSRLTVEYRVHNRSDAVLAVFDRGVARAGEAQLPAQGRSPPPYLVRSDDADLTLEHVGAPLPQPAPTVPDVPLAARVAQGETHGGRFEVDAGLTMPGAQPRRVRYCIGYVEFSALMQRLDDGAEPPRWRVPFSLLSDQQRLCTPWFDVASGAFQSS